jgi:cytosine/adenosine deaminase-related metal-dependent hydrolase
VNSTLLLRNADLILTMDAGRRIADASIFVRDGVIEAIGPAGDLPQTADRVIDGRGLVVMPGLINTHHHLFQTLTRALPTAQNAELFDWLVAQYPIWGRLTSEAVYTSAQVGLAELLLSGCTTTTDHLYLFPNDSRLDDEIRAAQELGIRFHPSRGSMSLGKSQGGLPPDHVVQDEEAILKDCRRVIEQFHDPARYSMLRIVLAPCSPFSVTPEIMRDCAELARQYGVQLHTHVAETKDEERFCIERFGRRPVAYMERLGWLGPDVWWAHVVHVNAEEIKQLAATGTGVAHCPSSNMRLGSGIAPIREMHDAGVKVGLAVDGSASNDCSNLIAEARQALLLQRVTKGASAFTVMESLELATLGGARVLGRDDLGHLAPGMAADFVAFDLRGLEYSAAAAHDPAGALILCTPAKAAWSVINGKVVVERGEIPGLDVEQLVARQNEIARKMLASA